MKQVFYIFNLISDVYYFPFIDHYSIATDEHGRLANGKTSTEERPRWKIDAIVTECKGKPSRRR